MWCNVVSFRYLKDEAHSVVLNFLKSADKVFGTAIERRVTVVKSGHDCRKAQSVKRHVGIRFLCVLKECRVIAIGMQQPFFLHACTGAQ